MTVRARMLLGVAALLLVGLTACARRTPPHATAADAERANVSLAELQQGRDLVVSKCGSRCHKPPMPGEHDAVGWSKALDEMAPRANLDAMERRLIEQYLMAMAPQ